jgi:hypothetical protein
MLYLDRTCSLCVSRGSRCGLRGRYREQPTFIPGGLITSYSRRCFVQNKPSVCGVGYVAANGRQVQRTRSAPQSTKTKIVLSAAVVLSTAFTASAATKARLSHVHGPMIDGPMIYDMVRYRSAPPSVPARDYGCSQLTSSDWPHEPARAKQSLRRNHRYGRRCRASLGLPNCAPALRPCFAR